MFKELTLKKINGEYAICVTLYKTVNSKGRKFIFAKNGGYPSISDFADELVKAGAFDNREEALNGMLFNTLTAINDIFNH